MFKVPDNSISELHAQFSKTLVEENIQWNDLAVLYVITHLPANASLRLKNTEAFFDHSLLSNKHRL